MWYKVSLLALLFLAHGFGDMTLARAGYKFPTSVEIGLSYWRKPDSPQKFDAYLYGMNAAAKEINQAGGLAGHEIKIVPYDDQGSEEQCRQIAASIAANQNMVAVVGFSNSARAVKSIEPVSLAGIPILSSAGSRKVYSADPNEVFFSTNFGTAGEARYFKAFAAERNYRKVVSVFKEKDGYSAELQDEIARFLPTANIIYAEDNQDEMIEALSREVTPGTVVLISLSVNENAGLAKKIREAGLKNDIYLGRGGMVGVEFFENGGRGLKDIFELSTLLAGLSNEDIEGFAGNHGAYFSDEKNLSYLEYATYAYDMVNLINATIRGSGQEYVESPLSLRGLLKDGLSSVQYEGVTDSYSFNNLRGIDSFTSQYLLEATGSRAIPYKKQFAFRRDELLQIPVAYMNIDILGVNITNQEASSYDAEFILTITSILDITIEDIDFENVIIGNSNFLPSIYAKEFITDLNADLPEGMTRRSYKVYGAFSWDNTIEEFPFDTQDFGLLLKPKDPINKDFLVYFTSQDKERILSRVELSGWQSKSLSSGYKKGHYLFSGLEGAAISTPYYRSSIIVTAKRFSLSPAFKFIFPLTIVLLATVALFFIPMDSNVDKLGAASNMLITVIALYFTYATIVDVNYITMVDIMYFGALAFVIISKIGLIMEYNHKESVSGIGFIAYVKGAAKHYKYIWTLNLVAFIGMIGYAIHKLIG